MKLTQPILVLAMLLSGGMAFAQGTLADYQRAYALRETYSPKKVFFSDVTPQWIGSTHRFWYVRNAPQGRTYLWVDADRRSCKELFNHAALAAALSKSTGAYSGRYPFTDSGDIRSLRL